jgi:hypothetical protein
MRFFNKALEYAFKAMLAIFLGTVIGFTPIGDAIPVYSFVHAQGGIAGPCASNLGCGGGSSSGGGLTIGGTITSGTDTRVLFQDGTVIGQDAGFTFTKATDSLALGLASTESGRLELYVSGSANRFRLTPNAAPTQNVDLTTPPDDGSANQVIQTDGAGALTFVDNPGRPLCTVAVAGADYTNNTTTLSDVTGLGGASCALAINTSYMGMCLLSTDSAANTTGIQINHTLPAGATSLGVFQGSTATAGGTDSRNFAAGTATAGTNPTSNLPVQVWFYIDNAGNAGNWQLQAASEVAASQIDINIGSRCRLWKTS